MKKKMPLPHNHENGIADFLEDLPDEITFFKMSDIFDTISDASRLKILWLLCHSMDCVTNIAAALDMSMPAVSHHLRILKQSGLLTSKRYGKEVHYTLAETEEAKLVHRIVDATFLLSCTDKCY